jgi:hypothetical protein
MRNRVGVTLISGSARTGGNSQTWSIDGLMVCGGRATARPRLDLAKTGGHEDPRRTEAVCNWPEAGEQRNV